MIPVDSITAPDDQGRMWWVLGNEVYRKVNEIIDGEIVPLDRPCDEAACVEGSWLDGDGDIVCDCERCHGTGRHVFEIEAGTGDFQCPRCRASFSLPLGMHCDNHSPHRIVDTLLVHVVPGMWAVQLQQVAS